MSPNPTADYHLRELAIASDPMARGHSQPPIQPHHKRILDVGCGAGQTLIASDLAADVLACGVDLDLSAVTFGRQLTSQVIFACARAEHLPYRSELFDLVISRVSLPYTNIPRALSEISRVLKPRGDLWITLHPLAMTLQEAARSLRRRELRVALFQGYVIANGLALHLGGRQFRFPLGRRPCESFQTSAGIVRVLGSAGFEEVKIRRGYIFSVTARKTG